MSSMLQPSAAAFPDDPFGHRISLSELSALDSRLTAVEAIIHSPNPAPSAALTVPAFGTT